MSNGRYIDLPGQRWQRPQPREWAWTMTSKNNPTTRVGDVKIVIFPAKYRAGRFGYCSLRDGEEKWGFGPELYATLDEAKAAALRAFGIGHAPRTPVAPSPDQPSARSRTARRIKLEG